MSWDKPENPACPSSIKNRQCGQLWLLGFVEVAIGSAVVLAEMGVVTDQHVCPAGITTRFSSATRAEGGTADSGTVGWVRNALPVEKEVRVPHVQVRGHNVVVL